MSGFGQTQSWESSCTKGILLPAGFADPFHPVDTITLDNPKFRLFGISLMKGKLDWVLLRRLTVTDTSVGNHDYSASDHKWLCADVTVA